jgi:prophage tail gpP-like protein
MSELQIRIGNNIHTSWESVEVFQSIDSLCGSFIASTSNYAPGDVKKLKLDMADDVVVSIGDTKLCSGYFDMIDVAYGEDFSTIEISGRDKTMDLVDCTFPTSSEWKNQTYRSIIEKLIAPFGISLTVESSAASVLAQKVEMFTADTGDTVAALISGICRDNGLLANSLGDGKLTISTSSDSTELMNDQIIYGQNAVYGRIQRTNADRFSSYIVKGVGISTDNKGIADYASPAGEASDDVVGRTRPMIILAEGPVNSSVCKRRAQFESMLRAGKSAVVTYELPKWTQSNGKLWKIKTKVRVKDTFLGVDDTMLIHSLLFSYTKEEGRKVFISVIHKDSYTAGTTASKIKTGFDS